MKNICIRPCQREDLSHVLKLQHQWVEEGITHGLGKDEMAHLEGYLEDYFYLVLVDDVLVGYAFGRCHKAKDMAVFKDDETYFELEDLYIKPEHRSSGLGSLVLNEVMAKTEEDGVKRALLYSASHDLEGVIKFYKKHKFKTWYVQMYK